jgi:hypothetical protein
MLQRLRSIWKPAVYQGSGRTQNYFEGWYFKCVSADERTACAVIPGVSLTGDPASSHAFIQVLEAATSRARYFRYPLAEFRVARDRFDLRIGPNRFGPDGLVLDAEDGSGGRVRGEIALGPLRPWPVRALSPGVMGWYAFVPSMECYHGVLSFDHRLQGRLEFDGRTEELSGGKGYLEKDWGTSFPAAWIWTQTNHFDEDGVSLSGSIARIPWRGSFFTGIIFGLLRDGKVHRFTTYTGARVRELRAEASRIVIRLEDRRLGLVVEVDRKEGADLRGPVRGEMSSKVQESLRARVSVALYELGNEARPLFSGTGRRAGLEFVGDIEQLLLGLKVRP